jgi:hypothetical protein
MKAIKSVLANRKLFQGGGLVPPGNINPANGILASSESLIDAVVRDAVGPQGGPTMSMNQGGVARFAEGGNKRQKVARYILEIQSAQLRGDAEKAARLANQMAQEFGADVVAREFGDLQMPRDMNVVMEAAGTETIATPPPPPPGSVTARGEPVTAIAEPREFVAPRPISIVPPSRGSADPFVAPPGPGFSPVPEPTERYGWGMSPVPPGPGTQDPRVAISPVVQTESAPAVQPTVMERIDTMVPSQTPDLSTAIKIPRYATSLLQSLGVPSDPGYDVLTQPTDARVILEQQQSPGPDLVNRLFPSQLQPGQLDHELAIADIAADEAAGIPMSRFDRQKRIVAGGLSEIAEATIDPIIQSLSSWLKFEFDPASADLERSEIRSVAELVQRGRPEWKPDIAEFARLAHKRGLTGDEFKADIAKNISLKYEDTGPWTTFESGEDRARLEEFDYGAAPVTVAEGLKSQKEALATYESTLRGVEPAVEPAEDSTWPVEQEELISGPGAGAFKKYMADKGLDITEDSLYEMYKHGRSGDFPEALAMIEDAVGPRTLNKFSAQYDLDTQETEVVETPDGTETVTKVTEDGVDRESLVEGLKKHGEDVAKRQMDLGAQNTLEREAREGAHDDFVARIREAANAGNQEETKNTLETYIEQFKSAMPAYEGKTEWEQGMDIVKMGMAIAAGQDRKAVTNIANGVLATIDNFTSDDKERRAYKREIGFAAAKYGLDAIRTDLVQDREDVRQIEWFYDGSKATEDDPHGPLVPISMADILSGDVDMTGLVHPDIVEKKIDVLGEIETASIKALADELEAKTITPTEGKDIETRFNNATELFETSTAGIKAFRSVIQKLVENPDDYLGGMSEVKSLWGKAMVFAGVDPGKKWLNRKAMEADMKIGFQKLIIGALKGVQSANSISNRDVSFLADAYIDAGFLTPDGKGGFTFSTDLATQRPEILVQRLQAGIEIFRDGQQKALSAFDMNVTILQKANAKGRYGPETYRGQIETLMPYAEVARRERAKGQGVMEYATAIEERPFYYEFDPDAGYKRLKGKEGSPFAGQFFSPTDENWAKFEGG